MMSVQTYFLIGFCVYFILSAFMLSKMRYTSNIGLLKGVLLTVTLWPVAVVNFFVQRSWRK